MEQQADAPPEARAIVDFLRNTSQIPLRNGLLNGTRYSYFHGTRAVAAMLSPQYQKTASKSKPPLPVPKDEAEAAQILHSILPYAFFLRVERGDRLGGQKKPDGGVTERMRELKVVQQQMFQKEMHFAWFYEGSQLRLKLMGLGMVGLLLAGVMFPLWPPFMRQGVWYLSIGLLGLVGAFFVLAIIRLILWGFSKVIGKPFWLFPNLFADVGFVDSFIPVWEWDVPPPPKKSRKARLIEQKQQLLQQQRDNAPEGGAEEPASLSDEQESKQAAAGQSESKGSGTATPATDGEANGISTPEVQQEKLKRTSEGLGDLD